MYNKLSGIFLPTPKLIPVDYYKKAAEILCKDHTSVS